MDKWYQVQEDLIITDDIPLLAFAKNMLADDWITEPPTVEHCCVCDHAVPPNGYSCLPHHRCKKHEANIYYSPEPKPPLRAWRCIKRVRYDRIYNEGEIQFRSENRPADENWERMPHLDPPGQE